MDREYSGTFCKRNAAGREVAVVARRRRARMDFIVVAGRSVVVSERVST